MGMAQEFIEFSLKEKVLQLGTFVTKAGRSSPYFFNAGLFNQGAVLNKLGDFYARRLLDSGIAFDMLFGPAYKGIPLVCATAMQLAERGCNVPFSFNRKEAKDHGEGGQVVGAPLKGRVVIVDDVISAGTSVNESVSMILAAGAQPVAVLIALDRMERSGNAVDIGAYSAVQEVMTRHQLPVFAIARVSDLLHHLRDNDSVAKAIEAYLQKYGQLRD